MKSSTFEEICEETFAEIFNRAKNTDEKKFLTNCFAFHNKWNHNILTYYLDDEFREVLELISDLIDVKESENINKTTKARMYLLIYTHIIEVDLIYLILYNMINTIRKKEYSPYVKYLNKKNEETEAIYPSQKIKCLQDIGHEINIDIESLYNKFFDSNLRNAFSHSQYYLYPSGDLENTKNISTTFSTTSKSKKVQSMYTYEDIECKFEMSLDYVRSFIKISKKSIKPYMDGNSHETLYGPIEFDSEHEWRFTQK